MGVVLQRQSVLLILLVGLTMSRVCSCRAQSTCGPISELVACLPAAEADVQPSAQCCTMLTRFLTTDPEACLCQAASSTAFETSSAAMQYAVAIPEKCNLRYKAGTQCNGVTIPGGQ